MWFEISLKMDQNSVIKLYHISHKIELFRAYTPCARAASKTVVMNANIILCKK